VGEKGGEAMEILECFEAGNEGFAALEEFAGIGEDEDILMGIEVAEGREDFASAGVLMGDEGDIDEGGLPGEPISDGAAEGAVAVVEDVERLEGLWGEELELVSGGVHWGRRVQLRRKGWAKGWAGVGR
jgi:hypothetical protein